MKRFSASLLLAMALSASAPAAALAAQPTDGGTQLAQHTTCTAGEGRGGAAALAALVAAAVNVGGVVVCDVDVLNNSLNNLLQNADIHVLENILNNSPILNDLTVTITDINVEVLSGVTTITVLGSSPVTITIADLP